MKDEHAMDSKVVTKRVPPNAGVGRRKGVQNKVTRDVKEMIVQALNNAGGVAYLTTQARANPKAFLALIGRVLPLQVTGQGGDPLVPTVIQIVAPNATDGGSSA